MYEKTMLRLAAEAEERHRNDPVIHHPLSESDRFWMEWTGWMKKRSAMGLIRSLSYAGKRDPTAQKAIGLADKAGKGNQTKNGK